MDINERAERVGRVELDLGANGKLVIAAHRVALTGEAVVDPVVALVIEHGEARGNGVAYPAADGTLDRHGAEVAVAQRDVALEFPGRLARVELDDAGRGIPAEQRALRAAQDLDALDVEQRETLEDDV